jgi:hypothetical protein
MFVYVICWLCWLSLIVTGIRAVVLRNAADENGLVVFARIWCWFFPIRIRTVQLCRYHAAFGLKSVTVSAEPLPARSPVLVFMLRGSMVLGGRGGQALC